MRFLRTSYSIFVAIGLAGIVHAEAITPSHVFGQAVTLHTELASAAKKLGIRERSVSEELNLQLSPTQVFYRTQLIVKKLNRWGESHGVLAVPVPPNPEGSAKPADTFKCAEVAVKQARAINAKLRIAKSKDASVPSGTRTGEVYNEMGKSLFLLDQLMGDNGFKSADVHRLVSRSIRDVDGEPMAFIKRSGMIRAPDVYDLKTLVSAEIQRLAALVGGKSPSIAAAAGRDVSSITPSDMYRKPSYLKLAADALLEGRAQFEENHRFR